LLRHPLGSMTLLCLAQQGAAGREIPSCHQKAEDSAPQLPDYVLR
jgi:hypothetical protein